MVRVLAVACYSIPLIPGIWLLLRERRSRFLRVHAAQSLVFFGLMAAAQVAIYVALLVMGGLTYTMPAAIIMAALFVTLFAALGLVALLTWFRLVWACIDGVMWKLPVAGAWAEWLERVVGSPRRPRY